MCFDLLARFTRFLNLAVAQAICAGPAPARWMAESWVKAYEHELGLLNDGMTCDAFHRAWEAL